MQNISTRRLILTLLWSAKWTAGAVALLCLAVYTDYSDFIIGKADASVKTVGVLKSWDLIGYFMALQFSMEGTVKKVSFHKKLLSASYAMVSISHTPSFFPHFRV